MDKIAGLIDGNVQAILNRKKAEEFAPATNLGFSRQSDCTLSNKKSTDMVQSAPLNREDALLLTLTYKTTWKCPDIRFIE